MRRTTSLRLASLGTAATVAALALPAAAAQGDLDLLSLSSGGEAANASSYTPYLDGDGDVVVFESAAGNLSPDDEAHDDIFLRRSGTGETILVSRASGPGGAGGDAASSHPTVSADGRYVAFQSQADNLSTDDDDLATNVFVRDTLTEQTILVSRATGANGAAADGHSYDPAISADGRYVVFESLADNLSADDDDLVKNIFLRDLVTNETFLVSRAAGANGAGGDDSSHDPTVSADGRYVAFRSAGDNLAADDDDTVVNVYVRDRQAHTTALVSRASGPAGAPADMPSYRPTIAADGRHVGFDTTADLGYGANAARQVYVRDLDSGVTHLISSAPDGALADDQSQEAVLSADGSRVLFRSKADNFSEDGAAAYDIFARGLAGGPITLVSRESGPAGAPAITSSASPAIAGDGRYAAFRSGADNLSAADDDLYQNLFRRDLDGDPPAPAGPQATPQVPSASPQQPATAARRYRCAGRVATIVGTPKRDRIVGTRKRDVIVALGGNDVVVGRGGNDIICLGRGHDRAYGGNGNDLILGQLGNDRISGQRGRDILLGGRGRDRLNGGLGNDRLIGHAGRDLLVGARGRDVAHGGAAKDRCSAERKRAC